MKQADALRRQLGRFVGKDGQVHINPKAKYPDTDFGSRLSGLAALLDANFPIRTAALTGPGSYDTHADQQGPLQDGAKQIAEGLYAFQADLERRGIGGRVLTLVWSEFGRRAQQNDSNGTDHGAAGRRVPDGHQGPPAHGRRVPGPDEGPRRGRQPPCHLGLPRRLLLARRSSGSTWTQPGSSRMRRRCRE